LTRLVVDSNGGAKTVLVRMEVPAHPFPAGVLAGAVTPRQLAEKAREEAFNLMIEHAASAGANAIVAMRYDANEITDGITEVLAYGTAVVVQPG